MREAADRSVPAVDRLVALDFEVDLRRTLGPLRHGPRNPTMRFERGATWRASRTTDGPATLRLALVGANVRVTAWGPGAERIAASVPRLLGADDDPTRLELPPGRLDDLARRLRGLRFGRTDAVMESLVPAIIGQKVTSEGAQRSYARLVARHGEDAPGPAGLRLPPTPSVLAHLPYFELHPLGIEQRRAVTLIRAAERAAWLEEACAMEPAAALTRLRAIPGVGAWTAAEVARLAFGDPDAVSLGDYHIPDLVAWVLAGEARGDDRRMLELLEPYRGQRGRLVRILELSGIRAPRYGPRFAPRSIERI